jgi:signal transduction histidine kinase
MAAATLVAPVRSLVRLTGRLRGEQVVLVLALVAGLALVLVETPLLVGAGVLLPLAFGLAVLHAGAVPAAVRSPNVAAPVSLAAALALQVLTADSAAIWPWSPVLIVTQCFVLAALATRTVLPVALLHWLVAVVASAVLATWVRPSDGEEISVDVVVFGGTSVSVILVALLLTQWQRVRGQLLQERRIASEESARRLVVEERTRIARELHDVVAHSLSIITVQASTARFRHRDVSPDAEAEFDRIAAQSRQALDEMRGLLRVLRGTEEDPERAPQPGLDDVPELVAQAAATGTDIVLDEPGAGWSSGVGALTGLTAFRIVQEATSNALRHAPGAAVAVRLARHGDEIAVTVENTASPDGPRPAAGREGHGLVGMRERAASVGGSVAVGPTPEGGFAVRALLPVRAEAVR